MIKRIIFGKDPRKTERAHHVFNFVIRVVLIIAIISAIIEKTWLALFISILALALTFLPKIIEKTYKIDLPLEFEALIVIFIFAAIFLGEVRGYYTRFWWWDAILHTGSGIALGLVGFAILLILYRGNKLKASPFTIALFSFSFAVAMGAIWEIFEFIMDQLVGTNMQKNGLVDTMWDLIVDSLGALLASTLGYLYLKKKEIPIFDRIIKRFLKDNKQLLKK